MTNHEVAVSDHFYQSMASWSDASLQKPWSHQYNVLLIASYLYYMLHSDPILSDSQYDALCAHLLKHYEEFATAKVWHRALVSRESLKSGSLFDVKDKDYPSLIRVIAYDLIRRTFDPTLLDKMLEPEDESAEEVGEGRPAKRKSARHTDERFFRPI
jgi:hypothetical protein